MSDIVERLRQPWPPSCSEDPLMTEAADEITALRAEVVELRGQHKGLVLQNALLRQRPDLPVDRIPAAKEVERFKVSLSDAVRQTQEQADDIIALRAEVERLRSALRGSYEVYAGSDGFIPATAAEGYQQQIIKQMVDCISAALEGK